MSQCWGLTPNVRKTCVSFIKPCLICLHVKEDACHFHLHFLSRWGDECGKWELRRSYAEEVLPRYTWISSIKSGKYAGNSVHLCLSAKPPCLEEHTENDHFKSETEEEEQNELLHVVAEEEDPYSLTPEDIYDTLDASSTYSPNPVIHNRPPAPIPRPEPEPERQQLVICRGVATIFDFPAEKHTVCGDSFFFLVCLVVFFNSVFGKRCVKRKSRNGPAALCR